MTTDMVRVIHIETETPAAAPRRELDEWLNKGYQLLDDDLAVQFYDDEFDPSARPAVSHDAETRSVIEAEVSARFASLAERVGGA